MSPAAGCGRRSFPMTDIDEEHEIKHEAVVAYLDRAGLDAVLLGRRCNFSWYTCGGRNHIATACDVGASWLLVRRDGAAVLTDNIEATRLRAEDLTDTDIELIEYPYFDADAQARAFGRAAGDMQIAADADPPAGDVPVKLGRDFDRLRWTLSETEIQRYRAVCDDTVAAVESTARSARPGETENALAGRLSQELQRRGYLPWLVLVAGDERVESYRHPLPTSKRIERYFMLVACAERGGLIASCTRIASFVRCDQQLADKHAATATVNAALTSATVPGAKLGDIFAEAQAAYAGAGFPDQWRVHHQGGSCGYQPRDVKAAPGDQTPAMANQAFAWNPSITGTKIERMILCCPGGPEPLARPTDWPVVTGEWKGQSAQAAAILVL